MTPLLTVRPVSGDGAGDMGAVAAAAGVARALARNEGRRQIQPQVGGEVGMVAADAGIKHGNRGAGAEVARVPGTRRINRRVAPLQVVQLVQTAGQRGIDEGGGIDLERLGLLVLHGEICGHRRDSRHAGGTAGEVAAVGLDDGNADLGQARADATAGGFDALGQPAVEAVAIGLHHIGGSGGGLHKRAGTQGRGDGLGEQFHGFPHCGSAEGSTQASVMDITFRAATDSALNQS